MSVSECVCGKFVQESDFWWWSAVCDCDVCARALVEVCLVIAQDVHWTFSLSMAVPVPHDSHTFDLVAFHARLC